MSCHPRDIFYIWFIRLQRSLYVLVLVLLCAFAEAQQDSSVTSERRYFRYTYSNDFFTQTDRYFTQEVHPELVLKAFRRLPLMKLLLQLKGSVIQYGLDGTHDCFTPASIRRDSILHGDRPYAGTLTFGHFKVSNDSTHHQRLTSQLDLGAMGPCTWCGEEQKGIHRLLDNLQPIGWENQVANDICINYRVRYEKGIIVRRGIDLVGLAEANAGTIYDNLGLGSNLRIGLMQGYFDNRRSRKLQFYGLAQGWIRLVGYNATLQGGMFSHSPNVLSYPEVAPVVLKAVAGTGLSWRRISVEQGYVFITREIRSWWDHAWGYISICAWF